MVYMKYILMVVLIFSFIGCAKTEKSEPKVLVEINNYQVTLDEFNEGFSQSAFASHTDQNAARLEYLNSIIDQKVILLDAQKKNIDKQKDFLRSIERFWEQSLLTVAMGIKMREISSKSYVSEDQIRQLYEQMVKEGIATKSYQEMYAQIRWQAEKQAESQALKAWIENLRKKAKVIIDKDLLKVK